ncbi:MAG: hypothetical protein H8D43_03155 [Chloroflexi bacterium]|nr:hypothetical protein [Chloroflexota bacterium]
MIVHNKALRRLVVASLVLAATLVVGFASGDGPLAFQDDRPLVLTWEQVKSGADVAVCNVSAENLDVQSLWTMLAGFNFQVNKQSVADKDVLSEPDIVGTLGAGGCADVRVKATDIADASPLDPGEYKGLLVVSGQGAGIIRREVTVQVKSPAQDTAPAEGAVGKLAFEDDRPITLTWEQAKAGVDVLVCNDGNANLQSLQAKLAGFAFQKDKKLTPDEAVLRPPVITATLEASDCTKASIQATDETIPDPGEYTGRLVVSGQTGQGVGRIHRDVTVVLPPVKGAVDEIILTATRSGPWDRKVALDTPNLPLKPAGAGEALTVAEKDTHIGIIYSEEHLGHVYIDGGLDESQKGVALLPIRVEALDEVGTYTGNVDVAGSGDEGGDIGVKVKVADHIGWAIGAIGFGLVLALASMFYMQRWRYVYDLKRRRNLLVENYRDAKAAFDDSVAGSASFKGYEPDYDAIEQYRNGFDEALRAYTGSYRLLFDTSSEEFKKLIKTLETAENDAQVFGDPENERSLFGQSLQKLHESLESFRRFVNDQFVVPRRPAFVKHAAYLLEERKLKVGEAQKIKNKADEYVEMIKQWKAMAAKIRRYRLWGQKLLEKENELSGTPEPMPNRDSEMLRRALARVEEACNEMLDATDAPALASLGAAEDLKRAYGHLAYLGGRYQVWVHPDEEERLLAAWAEARGRRKFERERWFLSEPFVITAEEAAVIIQAARWTGDVLVLALGVALAFYTGLTTLYFDKTFGTVANYLSAIALALATPTVLKFLTDALKQFGTPLES